MEERNRMKTGCCPSCDDRGTDYCREEKERMYCFRMFICWIGLKNHFSADDSGHTEWNWMHNICHSLWFDRVQRGRWICQTYSWWNYPTNCSWRFSNDWKALMYFTHCLDWTRASIKSFVILIWSAKSTWSTQVITYRHKWKDWSIDFVWKSYQA